ncbi:oligopeptide ABC transporter permease [Clostridium intestinale]|uniref:Binding-protein-dependent transport system inner membrane protein n=2 Tax=Clostridium intestinale TaxID=36845 RepID=U2PRP8_9CLOT|nr:oligopeptide ABC transporter permease [Clostridium intestinale]ERK29105.1 binding-protein-dependent transport system inner membrane protein [Clostridium intestinale URNW]SHI12985.1 oligopeptide transport system permease protein [Clostridium intestinale DSM 6191]
MSKLNENLEFLPNDFELVGEENISHIDKSYASQPYFKDVLNRFVKNKGAVIGLVFIILITLMAVIGVSLNGHTYESQIISQQNLAPRVPGLESLGIFDGSETMNTSGGQVETNKYLENNELKDVYYWFGSDVLGRDIFTRTWMGTRISLYIALIAVLIDMLFGLSYGLISGYFGGAVDNAMQRFAEILNGIPNLVIVTLLIIVLKPGLATITFSLMITGWIGMSRIARAQMLKLKEQEFVLASRTLGAKDFFIIFKEILPNILGAIITNTMFSIPNAIFTEAFLAFIGLGVPPPMASLGSLISESFKSFTTHPYMIMPPVIVLAILMLSFNMLADGIRDAFDPKMKES